MENEHKELETTCPFCKAVGTIKIPVQIYSQKKWGTVKIQVPPGAICKEHQFIVLVDTKGIIRGTEKVELVTGGNEASVDAPQEFITLNKLIEKVSLKNMHYILHALIFNYPIYVAKSESLESTNQIKRILDQVVTENLRAMLPPIEVIEEVVIQDIILNEKNSLLIGAQNEILQVPWKEKLKYEEGILEKARDIFNEAEQLLILQQEIAKLARDSELARGILEYYDEISRDEFTIELTKKMRITKIDKGYINMIKLFVEKRFSKDLIDKIKKKIKAKK
jgi:hypothetical protein